MVDAFTHSFIDNLYSEALEDAIIVREKNYFYTSQNTSQDDIENLGRREDVYGEPKGDLDFAVIYLESEEIEHYEFTRSERSAEKKRHHPEEQVSKAYKSVMKSNEVNNTDWSYEHEILFAEDHGLVFDYPPPKFEGEQLCKSDTFLEAKDSEAFEALNESLFEGNFWSKKIEEIKDFS